MKTRFTVLKAFVVLLAASLGAKASVILQDDFTYSDGALTNVSLIWTQFSGNLTSYPFVTNNQLYISQSWSDDVYANLSGSPYAAASTNILYAKFNATFTRTPTNGSAGGYYFAHFKNTPGGNTFLSRVFAMTNGAAGGSFRLGIANGNNGGANTASGTNAVDLSLNTTYTVVTRLIPFPTNWTRLWVTATPATLNETSSATDAADSVALSSLSLFTFREPGSGTGTSLNTNVASIIIDNLVVGTRFADVIPASAGSNPPFIVEQPADVSAASGTPVTLSVSAGGDVPSYQWYKDTNATLLVGATDRTYAVDTSVGNTNGYSVVVSNLSGITVTSRVAIASISQVVVPPGITNQPASQTVNYGDSVTFSVGVSGTAPFTYQWYFNNGAVSGATSSSYSFNNAFTNRNGTYSVAITNSAGFTNSDPATLTVVKPPLTNIAYLRSLVDTTNYVPTNTTSLFRAQGTVTTKVNMTSSTASDQFFIQDGTGGIACFFNGQGTNQPTLPTVGDLVEVIAPLSHFNGLQELNPFATNITHSVTVLSSGNALPAAQPVPFDPTSQTNPVVMEALEGSFVVASNVTLSTATPYFSSSSGGEPITDGIGQTFTLFCGAYTDVPGQLKPPGLVTIYGILTQFAPNNPRTTGYEIVPRDFDDVVSSAKGATVRFTNVFSNLIRPNGAQSNTLFQNPLRPGEGLTMYIQVYDSDGGSVTITPLTDHLPGTASWSLGATTGTNLTGTFTFNPVAGDAGSNYLVQLQTQTANTTATNVWEIYVPTPTEQQVFITEFLANPTTSTGSPYYNPLHRADPPTNSVDTFDEYIEIVNLSSNDVDLLNWTIADAVKLRHQFYNGAPGESLAASNAIVVYGGPLNGNLPTLPVLSFPSSEGSPPGLALNNTGTENITLRNGQGHVVDRVTYLGSSLSDSGSLSRFPTVNDDFVRQPYISTNLTTAGLQYDGGAWGSPTKVPAAVTGVVITAGDPVTLSFTADPTQASTVWKSDDLGLKFAPFFGQQFPTPAGTFYITNPPTTKQFYFITTQ